MPFLHRLRRDDDEGRVWGWILDRVLARPGLSALLAGGVLVALAIPALGMKTVQITPGGAAAEPQGGPDLQPHRQGVPERAAHGDRRREGGERERTEDPGGGCRSPEPRRRDRCPRRDRSRPTINARGTAETDHRPARRQRQRRALRVRRDEPPRGDRPRHARHARGRRVRRHRRNRDRHGLAFGDEGVGARWCSRSCSSSRSSCCSSRSARW